MYIDDSSSEILENYNQVFNGIKHHTKKINNSDIIKYDKNYFKIIFNTNDDIPLNKMLYIPTITVVIRYIFKQNGIYYPQIYLDDCLYQV